MDYTKLTGTKLGRLTLQEHLFNEAHMVSTYRALQPALNRVVAVQVLNPRVAENELYQRGFILSAEMMATLEHPNIAPVHDYDSQDGLDFIVMRLMEGGSLRQRLQLTEIRSKLALKDVATFVRQIGSALEYVHARGFVHGDPSLANIVFDQNGNAYVGDFHVAGFLKAGAYEQGSIVGTPLFTAPEKLVNGQATSATDQYALARIAFEAVSRLLTNTTLEDQLSEPTVLISPEMAENMEGVLNHALAERPEDRYSTIMDFAREFEKSITATPKHLFISYSRRDKVYAQSLTEHLQHNGFTVWIDSQIEYGDAWFKDIEDAIKDCAAFLLIMSPESYESEWVNKEILLAKRYKKPIFPLLLEGEEFGIVIDIQFADVRAAQMPETDFHRRLRRTVFGDV